MKILFWIIGLSLSSTAVAKKRPLIIDHDGAMDDVAAIAVAHLSKKFSIELITVTPANSLPQAAVPVSAGIAKFLAIKNVQIATGSNEGKNQFPEKWRDDATRVLQFQEMQLNDADRKVSSLSAPKKLAEFLSGKKKYEILATGPLTNIADALKINPNIKKNIKKIYFMGGAIRVAGNVRDPERDGSAEWNVYNNPKALETVLEAKVPVVFIALDATNRVPVTKEFMNAMKAQDKFPVSHFFNQVWENIAKNVEDPNAKHTWYIWDALAAVCAANPRIGELKDENIKVVLEGKSEGRIYPDPKGYPIKMLVEPDARAVDKYILSLLAR